MFVGGAINAECAFEENIGAVATAKKVMQALRSPTAIKECEDYASVIDIII